MKKVGLLTFHRSYNCGSLLQAYALQTVLDEKYKIENEFINFSNEGQRELYSTFSKPHKVSHLIRNMLYSLIAYRMYVHKIGYERFIKNNLKVSPGDYRSVSDLSEIDDKYEGFIVGSDQIWNTKCADADDAYYLSFTNSAKKYAYAVSFGANNIAGRGTDIEARYAKLINSFDIISVRESNAVKWVRYLTGREADLVADPTLLISRSEYDAIARKDYVPGKYIFFYSFGYDPYASEIVAKYANQLGLPVYVVDARQWLRKKLFRYGFKLVKENGPDVFLSLMKNAEYVFTTSLHGTIFATIYEKKFWYLTNKRAEELAENADDRAISLLNQLGLVDRFVTGEMLEKIGLECPIDYAKSNKKKEELVAYSYKELDTIVNRLTQ